ncbi:MAG: AAA family ATPase [Deltaproteobacteria bacterium]|nr:AAA family ATPase [Deltaproteobacteria bacterium]
MAIYRFGAFELDAARGELHRAGKPVPAERRAVELLLHLLRNRDRVVSKEELLAGLWPGVAVQDRVVNQAIYNARKLLGDDTRAPRFIATLRGRGFRFVAEVEEAASPRALPFTGRAAELRALQRALEAARRGQGGALLICGGAGSGKTRLAGEFAARARALGARVQSARCTPPAGAPGLWPWRKLLRGEREARPAKSWREVLQRHPHLGHLSADGPDSTAPAGGAGEFLVFEAVARYGAEAGAEAPLVLILDDLHWADAASVRLLRHLALEAGEAAVLLIATCREGELAARSELREPLAELLQPPHSQRLALGGLSAAEVADFARAAGQPLGREEARLLAAYSGGNPAALHHLCGPGGGGWTAGFDPPEAPLALRRAMSLLDSAAGEPPPLRAPPAADESGGAGGGAPGLCESQPVLQVSRALPAALRDLALAQLAGLPAATREALDCAAALGSRFETALLAALLGESEPEAASRLAPALRFGLLREAGETPARLDFAARLLRDALYGALAPGRRSALHERALRALESGAAGRAAAAEELALHMMRAGRAPSPAELDHCERAAREAQRRHEFARLLPLARRAVELAALLSEPPQRQSESLCRLGAALHRLGEIEEAQRVLSEAADWARRAGSPALLAQAGLQLAPALSGMRPGHLNRQALPVLEEALHRLPPGDAGHRALVASRLALLLHWEFGASERRETALALAEQAASQAGERERIAAQIVCAAARWRPEQRVSYAELCELRRAAERLGLVESAFLAGVFCMADRLQDADLAAVEATIAGLRGAAAGLEFVQARWLAALCEVSLALNKGDFNSARQRGARVFRMGPGMVGLEISQIFEGVVQLIARFHGVEGFGSGSLEAALSGLPRLRGGHSARALLLFLAGRHGAARQTALEMMHELPSWPNNTGWMFSVTLLAETVCELELREHAEALRALLHPHREALLVMGPGASTWGAVARVVGRLAVLAGRAEEAAADFEMALRLETRAGLRAWRAHSLWHYGAVLQSRPSSAPRGAALQKQARELAALLATKLPAGR